MARSLLMCSPVGNILLKQLVYVSHAANTGFSDSELQSILMTCRLNNVRDDITGLLLYRDGSVVQFLEGPADKVDLLFANINDDTRHTGLIKIYEQSASRRSFSSWSIAFKHLDYTRTMNTWADNNDPRTKEQQVFDEVLMASRAAEHPECSRIIASLIKTFQKTVLGFHQHLDDTRTNIWSRSPAVTPNDFQVGQS